MNTKTEHANGIESGNIMVKLLMWARPYWPVYIAIGGIVFVSALMPVGQAEGIRRLIHAIIGKSYDDIWVAFGLFAFVIFSSLILDFVRQWLLQKLANRSVTDLQREVMEALMQSPLLSWSKLHSGDKMQRLFKSTESALDGLNQKIPNMIQQLLSILFLVIYLSTLSWKLLLGAVALGVVSPLLSNLFSSRIRRFQQSVSELEAIQQARLQEQFQGTEVIRGFGLRKWFNTEWFALLKQTRHSSIRLHVWQVAAGLSVFLGFWIGHVYILGIGAWMVKSGSLEIGAIAAFLVSYERLVYPLSHLLKMWANIQDVRVHAARVFELAEPAQIEARHEGGLTWSRLGGVEIDRVTFGYEEGKPILQNISARIQQNYMTAIIGESGGGKSTLLKLIAGLYRPEQGEIRLGEATVGQKTWDELRSEIAYVPQEFFIMDASVADNIRIGKLDATLEEIVRAAKLAGADDYIQKLPNRYDTRLGERGQGLSGGERQRLALARAFVREPRFLLMDEPSSSLDTHHEQLMLEALERIRENCTIVMVSHKLPAIRRSDYIIVIENGEMVEQGTPQALLDRDGRYAYLLKVVGEADGIA